MILVVDDHPDIRRAMSLLLELEGYQVSVAASGEEALASLASPPLPHCVILDLSMPGMDGFDVLRAIRDDDRLKSLRVIVYSAHDGPLKDRAMAAGADAFVLKASLDWTWLDLLVKRYCCDPARQPVDDDVSIPTRHKGVG